MCWLAELLLNRTPRKAGGIRPRNAHNSVSTVTLRGQDPPAFLVNALHRKLTISVTDHVCYLCDLGSSNRCDTRKHSFSCNSLLFS